MHKILFFFFGKLEGKRPLGRPRRRCEDNIRMYLRETALGCGLNASGSGYRSVVGPCEHGNKPSGSRKSGKFLD
jgi:hypothetical protein